ncbi:MAG: type II secretion system minor pseudopilin GspK [Rhodothalassiaceae bacterium]
MTSMRRKGERGAILIGMLAFISAVAALSVAMTEDMRTGAREASLASAATQGFFYAVGVEEMTADILSRSRIANDGRDTLEDAWLRAPMRFPIENGLIEAEIADGGNCFNLNSLVSGDPRSRLIADPVAREEFLRLLGHLEIAPDEADRIAAAIVDYLDSDSAPTAGGAEDEVYLARAEPGRTPGTLLADRGEIRAVEGMEDDLYRRLAPFLCALPGTERSRLNINTLRPEQAPLLAALLGPGLSLATAQGLITDRPRTGYASREAFLDHPALRAFALGQESAERLDVRTHFYRLEALIRYGETRLALATLFEARANGEVRRLSRHFGADL